MFSSSVVALAVMASPALAAVFTTAPISTTTWTGGQEQTLTWQDDSNSPSAADFGPAKVGIYAGNRNQQTLLQLITDNVDVSTTKSIVFTPSTSIGPNSKEYFIRFDSIGLKDASSPQYPAQAFTAKFALTGMTGTFNASVQSQIDGASTAPIGASTSAAASSTGSASTTGSASKSTASTTGSAASKPVSSGSSKPSASAANDNGARSTAVAGATVALGALLSAVVAFM
jgi:hypothetical protein